MKRYLIEHGYTLLGFLLVVIVELEVKEKDLDADESVSFYGSTFSDIMFLKKVIPQKSRSCAKSAPPDAGRSDVTCFKAADTGC